MSRAYTFFAFLLAASPAALAAQDMPTRPDIVITGERLPDLQNALKACIERKCPPDQDITATLKVAEHQFVDGKYEDARSTLLKSIGRNKRFAHDYPQPVADLFRANYRIAAHLGDGEAFRVGTFDMVSALKAGLPDTDPRVLGGEIEVGDMYARFNRIDEAVGKYSSVERRAIKLGLYNIQGMARLRIVALYSQLAIALPFQYKGDAHKTADELVNSSDPHMKPFGQAARVLMARLDAKTGDTSAVDELIADYRATGNGTTPVLLYAPPLKSADDNDRGANSGETLTKLSRTNYDGEWVDIGFWVTPDGRVSDAGVLRSGKSMDEPYWVKPILTGISARRYAPLKMDPSQPGVMRVERYTLTARLTTNTGSRLLVREVRPQIEMLDLSADPPAGPKTS
jgi:hypothetical protein